MNRSPSSAIYTPRSPSAQPFHTPTSLPQPPPTLAIQARDPPPPDPSTSAAGVVGLTCLEKSTMAPRHVPRSLLVNATNYCPRRSRNPRASDVAGDGYMSEEVPFYAATRVPKTNKEKMKAAMVLRSGCTGYSVPVGAMGTITYPLSETEAELLYSMGDGVAEENAGVQIAGAIDVENQEAAGEDIDELVLGGWLTGLLIE